VVHPCVTARPYPQMPMDAEDPTPYQPPTLTELEEAQAGAVLARQIDLEWLMASDDPPDVGQSSPSSSIGRRGTSGPGVGEQARTCSSRSEAAAATSRRWPTPRTAQCGRSASLRPRGGVDGGRVGRDSGRDRKGLRRSVA
jgi:hypothetical protein